ncbi:uncharacterized protein LOC143348038 isoform X2 [Colletes latitarsis]|uniref:uncharacterized protein LOC143348038 isoform X2 n=1 Tax=Colletes latitarsis TaxID=2605962 RepID=UPI00403623C5
MNLALHGFLLQVFVSILNLQHGSLLCSAGEPGYLDFDNLPETNFSCQGKVIGGYYADVEAGCQMFHVCTIGQKDEIMDIKFLCLNGTVFDQETRVCERVDEVDCSKSERFYNLNLELYGNNAVTLSLHENNDDNVDPSDPTDDHQQRTTSARPTTSTTTTTTTSKPNKPSTTPASSSFSHPTGYPQHFQPQPSFPQVHTSQSKSLYDDKNGGYHHQYIFHNGERSNNQPATSYQLFSNQGISSTTAQPPQVHQIRFSSTSSPQIIHNEPSTVAPLFHVTSSTIQTLLSNNANSPALINPIFHNHGIASTTEQFSLHNNNPRETSEYRETGEQNIRPLEAVQSTNKGKISKLTISPVPTPSETPRSIQTKISQSSQQQRISGNFLPTPIIDETTIRSFYPTLRSASKSTQSTSEVTQHIHVLPPAPIPQLKPHQITINLPPPDIQRMVQNPSPLLPSQSRVIVTAKASVSDESGRPLNTTQLVTLPLPTIPASYDEYKEGDETFDPFYRDVPKIRNARRTARRVNSMKTPSRRKRSVGQTKNSMVSFVYGGDSRRRRQDVQVVDVSKKERNKEKVPIDNTKDFKSIKESLMKFRDILFGGEFTEDAIRNIFGGSTLQNVNSNKKAKSTNTVSLEDLETKASKNIKTRQYEDNTEEESESKESKIDEDEYSEDAETSITLDTKASDAEEYIDLTDYREKEEKELDENNAQTNIPNSEETDESETSNIKEDSNEKDVLSSNKNETEDERRTESKHDIDIVILDPNEYLKQRFSVQENPENVTEQDSISTDIPVLSTTGQTTTEVTLITDDDSKHSEEQDDEIKTNKKLSKVEENEEKEDFINSKNQDTEVEANKPPKNIENGKEKDVKNLKEHDIEIEISNHPKNVKIDEEKNSENLKEQVVEDEANEQPRKVENNEEKVSEESKKEKPKERVDPKPNTKRKSSRIRSSSGKISSRKKDPKSVEREIQNDQTLIIDQIGIHESATTSSPTVNLEIEQINKHIFDEPESQTSKELDTRAVGHHNNYPKSLQVGKDQNTETYNKKNEANEYDILEKQSKDTKDSQDKADEFLNKKEESTVFLLGDHEVKEDEKRVEELDSIEVTKENTSVEENEYNEESSIEDKSVKDESTTVYYDEDFKNDSQEDPETSDEVDTITRRGKNMKFETTSSETSSHKPDKNKKFLDEEGEEKESQEYSTVKGEEINSQEVSTEYNDSTESLDEDPHEISIDDDYKDAESHDELSISSEHNNSDEITHSKEEIEGEYDEDESTSIDQEDSTEGVLKFTDELPKDKKEDVSDGKKSSESVENIAHDYVDDNYEPDNYKERESTVSNNLNDEKTNKEVKEDKIKENKTGNTKKTDEDETETTTIPQDSQNDKIEEEIQKSKDSSTEETDSLQTTTPTTTTTTSTSTTTSTTPTTTTSTTTTTTVRPTVPKLFKPITARKNYNYIPPTTTPNPVIIKPRHSLLNPKPAKPAKSYNDLAPKPVIRKFPLLTRKLITKMPTTTVREEDSTKVTELPVTVTEASTTTTEASKSEENVLEGKLEKDQKRNPKGEPMLKDRVFVENKDDQESSPSEQKSPPNLKKEDKEDSIKNGENFTPYPISRLSTLASTIQNTLTEVESTTIESEMSTTPKRFTFADVEVLSTTVPSVASTPNEPDQVETTTSKPIVDEEISNESYTKLAYQDTTEISFVTESPTIFETTFKSSEGVESTTVKVLNRKSGILRRQDGFNCLEKEMYRFYGDTRDCRLFHYCSPGFTSRQVLDFRFVCEEGTVFDEKSQSCRHDVPNRSCPNRQW